MPYNDGVEKDTVGSHLSELQLSESSVVRSPQIMIFMVHVFCCALIGSTIVKKLWCRNFRGIAGIFNRYTYVVTYTHENFHREIFV